MELDTVYNEKIELGWKYFEDNEFEKAKETAQYLIQNFPDLGGGFYLLGLVCNELNEYEQSVSNFKEALALDPEKKNGGYINYWLGKNYNTRQSDYDFSAKPQVDNPLYNAELAVMYYENALEFEQYPEETIKELLRLLHKDYFKINNILKQAICKFPSNNSYVIQAADNFLNLNKKDEALELLKDKCIDLNLSSLYFKIGQILYTNSDYNFSRANFVKSLELSAENGLRARSFINYNIARTYFSELNWEEALNYYKTSYDLIIEYNFESPDFKCNDFWVSVFGIIACFSKLDKLSQVEEFVKDIPFLDEYLNYVEIELIFSLDNNYFDSGFELFNKIIIPVLSQIKKKSKDGIFVEKALWIIAILYQNTGFEEKRVQTLSDIGKLNFNNVNVLIEKLAESYSLCFNEKKSKKQDFKALVNQLKKDLENIYSFKDNFSSNYLSDMISCLFSVQEYNLLIDLKKYFTSAQLEKADCWFEIAYSYNEIDDSKNAEKSYEYYLQIRGNSGAALNNLANLYEEKNDLHFVEKAVKMYEEAIELDGNEELYNRNLKNSKKKLQKLLKVKNESEHRDKSFRLATKLVKGEDYFTIEILYKFLNNIKKEYDYKEGEIPIQMEYFPTLMNTNFSKSEKLKEQWISKNYIFFTEKSDNCNIPIYMINPYLEEEVIKQKEIISKSEIPSKWIDGIDGLNVVKLEQIEYFNLLEKINKINKKFKNLVERDFNELVFNYLIGNVKATVVLSGSFVELLLTYYLERKKNSILQYTNAGRNISKDLYDGNLFDLISFTESKGYFGKDFFHLTNLSRIYRNFVHPGLELKNELSKGKSDLCFISTMEILKLI